LGGKCVDDQQDLGKPLTSIVSAYFSVSGVNWGMDYCNVVLYNYAICNHVTGVYPYTPEFIKDINRR
jgi:hypothetical protein